MTRVIFSTVRKFEATTNDFSSNLIERQVNRLSRGKWGSILKVQSKAKRLSSLVSQVASQKDLEAYIILN